MTGRRRIDDVPPSAAESAAALRHRRVDADLAVRDRPNREACTMERNSRQLGGFLGDGHARATPIGGSQNVGDHMRDALAINRSGSSAEVYVMLLMGSI